MSTVTDIQGPQILSAHETFIVKLFDEFLRFVKDGDFYSTPHVRLAKVMTRAQAEEFVRKFDLSGLSEILPAPVPAGQCRTRDGLVRDGLGYWLDEGDGIIEERVLHVNAVVRYRFEAIPRWFINAMKRIEPDAVEWTWDNLPGGDGEASIYVFHNHQHNRGWFDHAGWSGEGEASRLIAEPYHVDLPELQDVLSFCESAGLDCQMYGFSNHYPGAALRIEIFPKQNQ